MATKINVLHSAIALALSGVLIGCGGSSEKKIPDVLSCEAPQVLNDNGSSCITPEPEPAPEPAPEPSVKPTDSQGVIYYLREDGIYDDWIIHAWNNTDCNAYADFEDDAGTDWNTGLTPTGVDENYGAYWLFDTKAEATCANFILHKGSDKDPDDNDHQLSLSDNRSSFIVSQIGVFESHEDVTTEAPFALTNASAHWLDQQTIVWQGSADNAVMVHSVSADLDESFVVTSDNSIALTPISLTDEQKARVPHLSQWSAFQLDATLEQTKSLLKQQLIFAALNEENQPSQATFIQTAKVLDAVYTSGTNDADEQEYGATFDGDSLAVSVWAPTASLVNLKVFDADKNLIATHEMTEDGATGRWLYTHNNASQTNYDRLFYRFETRVYHPLTKKVETLEATDPYSVSLSTNGEYSQFVSLSDEDLTPENWDTHLIPTIENIEDAVLLEGHIRDFSIRDESTSIEHRGKYLAFAEDSTVPVEHLKGLANAGVTHFHMLPTNDIATIEEDTTKQASLAMRVEELCELQSSNAICTEAQPDATLLEVLQGYDVSTDHAQTLIDSIRGIDGFNWGYDPHHFNVPEGSYASNAEGVTRIKEYRQMVQALHEMGLRVVMDVVYNHTAASGIWDKSVFDKLVPSYYHRYNEITGDIERSTCCENTATENRMMGKFVVDSMAHWAKEYGIDGFRFDIMGHMPKDIILEAREAVLAIDPDTYFYGEGWNWGEVANNRLFEQATQENMAGTEVGSFNDRPRDTIRAAALSQSTVDLASVDHIRLGLSGTLKNYVMIDQNGARKTGDAYSQSSYGLDPADIINYVSKHDNETLWDQLQYSLPDSMLKDERVRIHNLSAAIPLLSQGIPFFQLGVDMMRSKSMDRDSYDASDWYNYVDFTNTTNNWNIGLPSRDKNAGKYDIISAISSNPNTSVMMTDIDFSESIFSEFLSIRSGSPLFRLTSEQEVIERVGFHNTGKDQTAGLIVMSIDDGTGQTDLDPSVDALVVVINGTDSEQSHTVDAAQNFELHPIQQSSADNVVTTASFNSSVFTVPAHTIAVFVKPQGAEQGDGLSADPSYIASPFGDEVVYLRGGMNEWGTTDAFEYNGEGIYSIMTTLAPGSYDFKVGDQNWNVANLGYNDVDVSSDSIALTQGDGSNLHIEISQLAGYLIEVDVSSNVPVLKVIQANAIVSCNALEDSADMAPFSVTGGGELYLRGSHSGWGADEMYKFAYKGENRYQMVADLADAFQFKIASDDDSWTTQLWVQNASGAIETGLLALDTAYDVAYEDGGQVNNNINLASGTYSFLLTLNEADPAKGTSIGSLSVQQCTND